MSELDRIKEQLVYLFAIVVLGFGIFALHRQIERRIDQIGRL